MKYFKRLKVYKASNNYFNPETMTAKSYNWWYYVRAFKIKGDKTVILFNTHYYSPSTSNHQSATRSLMKELKIDFIEANFGRASLPNYLSELTGVLEKNYTYLYSVALDVIKGQQRTESWKQKIVDDYQKTIDRILLVLPDLSIKMKKKLKDQVEENYLRGLIEKAYEKSVLPSVTISF